MLQLPYDVQEKLIPQFDRDTLARASRVSRDWNGLATVLLYRQVEAKVGTLRRFTIRLADTRLWRIP